jgi:hypothetical protein
LNITTGKVELGRDNTLGTRSLYQHLHQHECFKICVTASTPVPFNSIKERKMELDNLQKHTRSLYIDVEMSWLSIHQPILG